MKNEWKLTIVKTGNGYILTGKFSDADFQTQRVIEEPYGEEGELIGAQNLLFEVKEFFAIFNSEHNKKNLVIKIEDNEEKE